jgi:hypothetical protein
MGLKVTPVDPLQFPKEPVLYEREEPQPGSQLAKQRAKIAAQQSTGKDFKDGAMMTAAFGAGRMVAQEAPLLAADIAGPAGVKADPFAVVAAAGLTLLGFRAKEEPYDKIKKYDELTAGIPYEFHDEIMENDGFESASRARTRIMDDLERGQRIAQQNTGTLAVLAGSLFDVDLPLILMSGGAFGAAKVSRTALRAGRAVNMTPGGALRLAGTAQGVNAGAQAGALIGAIDSYTRETTDWTDLVNMTFTGALLGGAIGAATKGDLRTSQRAAQQEFYDRISRDDPNLTRDIDIENMPVEVITGSQAIREATAEYGPSTAGAAQIGGARPMPVQIVDPAGPISPTSQAIIDGAHDWAYSSGWDMAKKATDDGWWAKAAMSGAGSFSANNFIQLYKSKSKVANYIAGTVFESPTGLGRGKATAAVRMDNYHSRIQRHLADDIQPALLAYAKDANGTWQGSGFGFTKEVHRRFNRDVMLEMNARAHGRTNPTVNPHVTRAADSYERAGQEALDIGRGRAGEHAVDGMDTVKDRRGYTPYVWTGETILRLERDGITSRKAIVSALSDSYRRAGMNAGKDAEAVAKAVINRAVAREKDVDTSLISLLSGDGKEWLEEALTTSGMSKADRDGLMTRLIGSQAESGKEGFAKMRNEIDMDAPVATLDGSDVRMVDLLDTDMHGVWQRYSRRMAGSAALARQGITNRAQRKEMIAAMQAEQRALGEEPIDGDLMTAMFSHFNGGPVFGFSRGHTNEGVGSEIAVAKRLTNISLLEQLGITQLAETGATMAQNGLQNWAVRGPMALFDKELRAGNKAVLAEMAYFTGRIGDDHKIFATHLDLDDVSSRDKGDWLRHASRLTSNAQYIQGHTSLFNQVRTFQQTTAALGVADKVFRTLREASVAGRNVDDKVAKRFADDLGLFGDDLTDLMNLVDNGTIEFKTVGSNTFVDRLNIDKWSPETAEIFGVSISRNVNQLVQKSLAGEQDAWMHTQWGSVLSHLKTFPLQAVQKQVLRNARHLDTQAVATLMMGMATAYVAVRLKDAINGKDRSEMEYAKAAFNYSNMTGFIPMVADPLMTIIGLEDYRFNKYGPFTSIIPPMASVANDMRRVPGALWDTAAGNGDYYDRQALKAIPFAGSYGFSRAFD